MPRIAFARWRTTGTTKDTIAKANAIIEEYQAKGFSLTLRQLYYQFVARGLIPNTLRSYKRLGKAVSTGRRQGLIDWDAIEDRTRFLRSYPAWNSPAQIVQSAASQFNVDLWEGQFIRPEAWVEKDALIGVLERACGEYQVPYFSCRGYVSDSEIKEAADRATRRAMREGQMTVILHFGDHDPSGVDMTRDIEKRLKMLGAPASTSVRRLALSMEQVEEYNPPPNPAKQTDTRFREYAEEFGEESWELDALNPEVIAELVKTNVEPLIDPVKWGVRVAMRDRGRDELRKVAEQWPKAVKASKGDKRKR